MKIFRIESSSTSQEGNNIDLTIEFYLDKDNSELAIFAQTSHQKLTGRWYPSELDKEDLIDFIDFLKDVNSKIS